jgi:hypothetical protein
MNRRFPDAEASRARLRATVAAIEHELSCLPRPVTVDGPGDAVATLLASFADLVEQLALGLEPEVRRCPGCGHVGMRAATRCGYCWAKLTTPPGPDGAVA